jgi:hypothetical protein
LIAQKNSLSFVQVLAPFSPHCRRIMSSATKATAASATNTVAPPAANTAKRDYLIALETEAQKRWSQDKAFETNSPYTDGTLEVPTSDFAQAAAKAREERPKWLGTFPYPVSTICFFAPHEETGCVASEGLVRLTG